MSLRERLVPLWVLLGLAILAGLFVLLHWSPTSNRAIVVDGDTIEWRGETVRLFGIDAPEGKQTCKDAKGAAYRCGLISAQALDALILGKDVSCEQRDVDKYKRPVSLCTAGGVNLSAEMVRTGNAVAYTHYSKIYLPQEQEAADSHLGMWRGDFELPWDYRARKERERAVQGFAALKPAAPTEPECCRTCTTGKPCGDSCIGEKTTCSKGGGCAC